MLCEALGGLHPNGYYAWPKQPTSLREQRDKLLIPAIKRFWLESGGHYGYRNINLDLKEAKISCGLASKKAGRKPSKRYFTILKCFIIQNVDIQATEEDRLVSMIDSIF